MKQTIFFIILVIVIILIFTTCTYIDQGVGGLYG